MALTPEQMLADAIHQQHLLVTGTQAKVFVDQNGERVEYTSASRAALATYIATLISQIARTTTQPMDRSPMRVLF